MMVKRNCMVHRARRGIMYNEGYAYGGDGSASSCMSVVDFIIHYAYLPSEKSFDPSLWLILRRKLAEGFCFQPFQEGSAISKQA